MDVVKLVETTVNGLGYELVDFERSGRGLLRVFIDKPEGILVDELPDGKQSIDAAVYVENVDYDRLEVFVAGIGQAAEKEADFLRFAGQQAQLKLRMPLAGRKNFVGVIGGVNDGILQLNVGWQSGGNRTVEFGQGAFSAKSVGASFKPTLR